MMQEEKNLIAAGNDRKIIMIFLGILVTIALGFVIFQMKSVFKPFCIALFVTYLLDPTLRFLIDKRIPMGFAIIIIILLAFMIFALVGALIYASVDNFVAKFPAYEEKFSEYFIQLTEYFKIPAADIQEYLDNLDWKTAIQDWSITSRVTKSVGTFISFLTNTFIVLLFTVFMLIGKRKINRRIDKAFSIDKASHLKMILKNFDRQIQQYLGLKTLISFATGFLIGVVLLIFGVEFAVIWGTLAFLLNFIPNIGSVIAICPPIIVAFLQSGSFWFTLWVAVSLISIQVTIGNIIEPNLLGKRLNLSPLVVILSLLFWGWLWGITGMILSVPIIASLKVACENIELLKPVSSLIGND